MRNHSKKIRKETILMKEIIEKLGVKENRFWGLAAILPFILLIIDILWWDKLSKEEKLQSLTVLIAFALVCVVNIIPIIGQIASIVMLVFYIIAIVKFFQGDLGYKIPIADAIAAKFVKD